MSPKKESAVQKAARLSKESSEANRKVDLYVAIMSIKHHAPALASIKHHLTSNGWWLSEDEITEQEAKECKKKIGDDKYESTHDEADEVPLLERPEYQVEVHRNFTTWSRCPPAHLTLLLSAVEELSLSLPALKSLRKGGQREVPTSLLLELFERACGVGPMALIGKRRKLCELAAYLIVRSEKAGRPCREIRLPARWNAGDGAYQLVFFSGCVCLRDKKLAVSLSSEEIGEGNFDDSRIETNYSVQRAVVRNDNDDTVSCNCLILIMNGGPTGQDR